MRFNIIFLLLLALSNIANATIIKDIKISGNQRIQATTVTSIMAIIPGEDLSDENLDKALKNLVASELFSDIKSDFNNGILRVNLVENPKVNKVVFEGNKKLTDEDLQKEIVLDSRAVYTKAKLQSDINRLIDVYSKQGRYGVKVIPKLVELPQNRIDLIFEIDEGIKSTIKKIIFEGNKNFTDSRLTSVIKSASTGLFSFLSSNDSYNPHKIEYDKELLTRFYKSKGYATFQVISVIADLNETKDKFFVTFTIEEGPKYKYGDISISSELKKTDVEKLKKLLITQKGSTFNQIEIEKTVEKISKELSDQGFAFVSVDPKAEVIEDKKEININFHIYEGRKAFLRQINIKGNSRTADKVIRREFRIDEGDAYNSSKIAQSEKRINELGFFETVDVEYKQAQESDKFDIDVIVTEKSTAGINLAGGYNTVDGPVGMINLTEKNLFGNGQELSFGVKKSAKTTSFTVSFTEPYFMDMPLAAGVDLYKSDQGKDSHNYRPYTEKSKGFVFRGGYEVVEDIFHQVRYSYDDTTIDNITSSASSFVQQQAGTKITSAVGQSFSYDKRDSKTDPTRGLIASIDQKYAGIGGNTKYIRHEVSSGYYIPVYSEEVILEVCGFLGHIKGTSGQDVRINNRFFIGGDELRGFAFGGIGPRAKIEQNGQYSNTNYSGDSLGGNIYYSTSLEMKAPINVQKDLGIFVFGFFDAGEVWNPDITNQTSDQYFHERGIRAGAGPGIGFNTPMGPIKLSYAFPLIKKKFDKTQTFFITFSSNKF